MTPVQITEDRLSDERLREMLAAPNMFITVPEIVSVVTEVLAAREVSRSRPAEAKAGMGVAVAAVWNVVAPYIRPLVSFDEVKAEIGRALTTFLAPEPVAEAKAEPVAWQDGERELAVRWATKLLATLSTKPDHVDDCLWLQRIVQLLAASPTPPALTDRAGMAKCTQFVADPCGSGKCHNCGGTRAQHRSLKAGE